MCEREERFISIKIKKIPGTHDCQFCSGVGSLNSEPAEMKHSYPLDGKRIVLLAKLPSYSCTKCSFDFYHKASMILAWKFMYQVVEGDGAIQSANMFIRLLMKHIDLRS